MLGALTRSGECTSGLTVLPRDEMKQDFGFAVTTSTTNSDPNQPSISQTPTRYKVASLKL